MTFQDLPPMGAERVTPEPVEPGSTFQRVVDSLRFDSEPPWGKAMGIAQILTVVAAAGIASVIGTIFGLLIDVSASDEGLLEQLESAGEIEDMIAMFPGMVVLGTIFQQLGQGLTPFAISKLWRGFGVVKDWGLSFKLIDVPIGVGLGVLGLLLAWVVSTGLSAIVGIDPSDADNGEIVAGFKDSFWLYPMLFAVVVGAPLSEEIAFRGVLQRSLSRFGGPLVGIFASSILFALVHIGGTSFNGQIVLWASIFMIGLVFAISSAYFKRIGPAIIGHVFNNAIAALVIVFSS